MKHYRDFNRVYKEVRYLSQYGGWDEAVNAEMSQKAANLVNALQTEITGSFQTSVQALTEIQVVLAKLPENILKNLKRDCRQNYNVVWSYKNS